MPSTLVRAELQRQLSQQAYRKDQPCHDRGKIEGCLHAVTALRSEQSCGLPGIPQDGVYVLYARQILLCP